MKQKWLTTLCALALALTCMPAAYSAEEQTAEKADAPVLVGLLYGSDTLPGANLKNSVGTGYRLGYLDEGRTFVQLGSITETDISVVKTQNVWYGTYNKYTSYSDKITSEILVGCWHVKLPYEVDDFETCAALASEVGGFPAWINGVWQVRLGAYGSEEDAKTAADTIEGAAVVGTSAYGVSVVKTGTGTVLFQFDGDKNLSLTVMPGMDDSVKTTTWCKGSCYYGGFQYSRLSGGDLTVSNIVPLEDYISCVVSQEMSKSWPLEALKAQAVCARTYYEINLGRHTGFDICGTTHCQAYPGMSGTDDRTAQAAQETAGLRAWYEGELAQTYYFSSSGGGTEDVRNVWSSTTSIPYLCGVIDPYEATVSSKISYWSYTQSFTSAEITALLQSKGYGNATIVDFQVTALTPTGNVKSIAFIDENGKSWPFTKESGVRNLLGLKSMRYTVTKSGGSASGTYYVDGGDTITTVSGAYAINGDGSVGKVSGTPYVITGSGVQTLPGTSTSNGAITFTVHSSGWGHSVGMSQWGAYAMAQQGFTYDQILTFYYPGIEIY